MRKCYNIQRLGFVLVYCPTFKLSYSVIDHVKRLPAVFANISR